MRIKILHDMLGKANVKRGDILEVVGESKFGDCYLFKNGLIIKKMWCEVYDEFKTKYLECIEDNNIFKKGDVAILVEDKGLVSLVKTTVNNNVVELNVMTRFFKEVGSAENTDREIRSLNSRKNAIKRGILVSKQNILNVCDERKKDEVKAYLTYLEFAIKELVKLENEDNYSLIVDADLKNYYFKL